MQLMKYRSYFAPVPCEIDLGSETAAPREDTNLTLNIQMQQDAANFERYAIKRDERRDAAPVLLPYKGISWDCQRHSHK